MEIVLATRNKNKTKEIKEMFKDMDASTIPSATILSLADFDNNISINENCRTIKGNAIKKATEVTKILNRLVLSDDSGLEVDVLKGAPGVFSARFAGEKCTYKDNNRKLLKLLKGIPSKKRNAKFRCVFALADRNNLIKVVEGVCRGSITFAEIGKNGFGYDSVFIPDGYKKTFAQMSMDEKNKISHRSIACNKIKIFLKKIPKTKLTIPK